MRWHTASSACARPRTQDARLPRPVSSPAPSSRHRRQPAIAVFIRTPSTPSSIAIAASDAVPTPASTISGTWVIISRRMRRLVVFWMPGRSRSARQAASRRRRRHRSGAARDQIVVSIGKHDKAFLHQNAGGFQQPSLSGKRVCSSPITSSLTQFDRPTSRPRRAVRMASSAV